MGCQPKLSNVFAWEVFSTNLAIAEGEDEDGFLPIDLLRGHLRGHPSFGGILLPCSRSHIVVVRHGTVGG